MCRISLWILVIWPAIYFDGTDSTCVPANMTECYLSITHNDCIEVDEMLTMSGKLDSCLTTYLDTCDEMVKDQWRENAQDITDNAQAQCTAICEAAKAEIEDCKTTMYSGLQALALEILASNVQPYETKCAIALKRIYVCMVNATEKCKALSASTSETFNSESAAFQQCSLVISSSTVTPTTTTTLDPFEDAVNDSTKVILLATLGVIVAIVLVGAVIALYMWIKKIRLANYKRNLEGPDTANNNGNVDQQQPRSNDHLLRDRSPGRNRQYQYDYDTVRMEQGPFSSAPAARWWTRPDFGTYGVDVQTKPF